MTENPYAARSATVSPSEERTMGTLAHAIPLVAMVVSAGTLGFVASLILYLIYKDRGPFVRENAANSLNIQITTGIVLLVSIPLMLLLVGFLTWGIALVVAFVLHLLGALKANRGEWWLPPMTLRLVH
jgi:uncharacterized protein